MRADAALAVLSAPPVLVIQAELLPSSSIIRIGLCRNHFAQVELQIGGDSMLSSVEAARASAIIEQEEDLGSKLTPDCFARSGTDGALAHRPPTLLLVAVCWEQQIVVLLFALLVLQRRDEVLNEFVGNEARVLGLPEIWKWWPLW